MNTHGLNFHETYREIKTAILDRFSSVVFVPQPTDSIPETHYRIETYLEYTLELRHCRVTPSRLAIILHDCGYHNMQFRVKDNAAYDPYLGYDYTLTFILSTMDDIKLIKAIILGAHLVEAMH